MFLLKEILITVSNAHHVGLQAGCSGHGPESARDLVAIALILFQNVINRAFFSALTAQKLLSFGRFSIF